MATYGITSAGFVIKPFSVIQSELETAFKTALGSDLDVSPQSVFGQWIGIAADSVYRNWELAESVYQATTPDGASGVMLDNVAALSGTVRLAPTYTQVTCVVGGTAGTVLTAGRTVRSSAYSFSNPGQATISTVATVRANSTEYQTGMLVQHSSAGCLYCTQGGITGAVAITLPGVVGGTVVDGTVTWMQVSTTAAAATMLCSATETGPLEAPAGAITTIGTPVSGWSSVINPLEHSLLGSDLETDSDLRLRRELAIRGLGTGKPDALRAALLDVSGVTSAFVQYNKSDVTDGEGLPPHSVECIVRGGSNADVANAIWDNLACGDATHSQSGNYTNVTDSQGVTRAVYYTRPTALLVHCAITVLVDRKFDQVNGETAIKNLLTSYSIRYQPGAAVYATTLAAVVLAGIPGVMDVQSCAVGTSTNPTGTSVGPNIRQYATMDPSRITVTINTRT